MSQQLALSTSVVYSNLPPDDLNFNPAESYAISYGIDVQTSPKFKQSLGKEARNDAKLVLDTLVKVGAVAPGNHRFYAASENEESCTANGMKQTFQEIAGKVGEEGLFIFHFSGHGEKVCDEWRLIPADFDFSRKNSITGNHLSKWLKEAECKAKCILVTLDCCHAEGIGTDLISNANFDINAKLYVLSACTAYEKSLILFSLGHSVMTYFLSEWMLKFSEKGEILPLKKIFLKCEVCCECLTSLFITYDNELGLQENTMHPTMSTSKRIVGDGDIDKYQFTTDLYNTDPPPVLKQKTKAYLRSFKYVPDGPLYTLKQEEALNDTVLKTTLCSMTYSIASIELSCDGELVKTDTDLSITAFKEAAAVIEVIEEDTYFDVSAFNLSRMFYTEAICKYIDPEEWWVVGRSWSTDNIIYSEPKPRIATDSDELDPVKNISADYNKENDLVGPSIQSYTHALCTKTIHFGVIELLNNLK